MRPLRPRQERFCQQFVSSANAAAAAVAAGYAPGSARNAGYRLLNHPRIAARITQIQTETARHHCSDTEVLIGKLEAVYRRAMYDHQFSAAARAVELQAKLSGTLAARATPAMSPASGLAKTTKSAKS
jgi:phage terminase small subunit